MPPEKKNILDLPLRRRIVETVAAHPGIHLRKLAESLGIAVSTLEYHCYQLVRTEHLNTREAGGFKAFFPASGVDRRDKDLLYMLRQDVPRRICAHLLLHPGSTPKQLKQILGVSGATLTFHLNKLRAAGLLEETPAGRTKFLSVHDPERMANMLVTYRQSFVDQVVDRFAGAWLDLHPPRRLAADEQAVSTSAAAGPDADAGDAAASPGSDGAPDESAQAAPTGEDPVGPHPEAPEDASQAWPIRK